MRKHQISGATKAGHRILAFLLIVMFTFGFEGTVTAQTRKSTAVKNIVVVHGAFADGSGWEGVHAILKKGGYTVTIVQNPLIWLEGDVAATKRAIANLNGPVVLVGHSYGGAVITEAGSDPKVVGRVYVAAFAPEKGESVSSMIGDLPPGAPQPPILPPQDGFLLLDRAKFRSSFAADVSPETAAFMADSQVPWGVQARNGALTEPASCLGLLTSTVSGLLDFASAVPPGLLFRYHIAPLLNV